MIDTIIGCSFHIVGIIVGCFCHFIFPLCCFVVSFRFRHYYLFLSVCPMATSTTVFKEKMGGFIGRYTPTNNVVAQRRVHSVHT